MTEKTYHRSAVTEILKKRYEDAHKHEHGGNRMKTKNIKSVKLRKYIVDCVENDPVDIKCGGTHVLGFDFFVDADKSVEEVKGFIKKTLKKYNKPLMSISTTGTSYKPIEHVWDYDRIEKCIKKTNFYSLETSNG